MSVEKKSFVDKLKEEFLSTTETLWENEISANLFVARVLLFTVILDFAILVLMKTGVFSINNQKFKCI